MDPNRVILDISSDEDGAWDEPSDESFDWLSELLDTFEKGTEESADVVFVGEASCGLANQKQKPSNAGKSTFKDDLDDDCVILDCDPDNPVPVVNDTADGSDELLIVGEKGQLACRDYPHPRHLCAKFPFSSTPHEKYCDLCHCYVCDSHAPCIYWGTGVSNTDHCHSTDEEIWRVQRVSFKQGKTASLPIRKFSGTTLSMTPPLPNSMLTHTLSKSLNGGSVPLHPVSKSIPLHPCSSSTSFGVPNIISQRHRSGLTHGRNRFPQHVSSRSQPMPGANNFNRRDRGVGVGTLGPQFVSAHMKFKRVGSTGGALTMNRSGNGSSNNNNRGFVSQPPRNHHPAAILNYNSHIGWQDFLASTDSELDAYQSSSQPNLGSSLSEPQSYMMSSQPQIYSQPIPELNDNQTLYPPWSPTPNATNPISLDFNVSLINSTGRSIQNLFLPGSPTPNPTVEDSQFQSVQPTYEPSTVTESTSHVPGSTNPGPSDLNLESWMYTTGSPKDSMPPELDFASDRPASVDPGMLLYGLESSWGDLAQM